MCFGGGGYDPWVNVHPDLTPTGQTQNDVVRTHKMSGPEYDPSAPDPRSPVAPTTAPKMDVSGLSTSTLSSDTPRM